VTKVNPKPPRKHHFLPQFYLSGFSTDGRGLYQIEKRTGRHYGCQIKDAGAMRDYHDVDADGVADRQAFEKRLAELEGWQATQLRDVLAGGILNPGQRSEILQLLAIMRMRVPAMKEHVDALYTSHVRSAAVLMEREGRLGAAPMVNGKRLSMEDVEITIANWKRLEVMFRLGMDEEVLQLLTRMQVTLYRAAFGTRFVTSDQPVAIYHPLGHRSGAGLATPGVQISFPLSSRACIVLEHGAADASEKQASSEFVAEINRRTTVMASEYVYTGESAVELAGLVARNKDVFAGFQSQSFDHGRGFLELHKLVPVGP
jgi:hypothetical protein